MFLVFLVISFTSCSLDNIHSSMDLCHVSQFDFHGFVTVTGNWERFKPTRRRTSGTGGAPQGQEARRPQSDRRHGPKGGGAGVHTRPSILDVAPEVRGCCDPAADGSERERRPSRGQPFLLSQ